MVDFGLKSTTSQVSFGHWLPLSGGTFGHTTISTIAAYPDLLDTPFSIDLSGPHPSTSTVDEAGVSIIVTPFNAIHDCQISLMTRRYVSCPLCCRRQMSRKIFVQSTCHVSSRCEVPHSPYSFADNRLGDTSAESLCKLIIDCPKLPFLDLKGPTSTSFLCNAAQSLQATV